MINQIKHFGNFLGELIIICMAVLTPISSTLFAVGFLILSDFITGIYAAYKTKTPITSIKMSNTIGKFVIYNLAMISGFAISTIIGDAIPVVQIIAGTIALVEFKSILENIQKSTGLDLFDRLKDIFIRDKK